MLPASNDDPAPPSWLTLVSPFADRPAGIVAGMTFEPPLSVSASEPTAIAMCDAGAAACGVVLLSADAVGEADDASWIKVAPRGRVTTRDGRNYAFDPERLAARFQDDGIEIPVDLDHSVSLRAKNGDAGTVVGWVKEIDARLDGLFARVEWLEAGRDVLRARTHRFVSPTIHHTKTGEATWLHSVALVAAPALPLPAVASAIGPVREPHQETSMKSVLSALGLAEGADEAACLAAITTLKANTVPKDVHDEALATLSAKSEELAALQAAVRSGEVEDLIEGALAAKKIVPAQRESYAALCATDEGLASVKKLLEATPASLAASGLGNRQPAADKVLDPATLAAKARALVVESRARGVEISIADAVNQVKEEQA
ncbi:phage protease [Stappia indica]|uniref:Mu-like prophage I protein n=1 Tax=Stappia indica TaxID=538381 RepID=A0A285TU24_9HYPH|nr:phage protease [Stappia indica]SOC26867.1 Mu-like prophage I protein [Stappia indica]